MTSVASTLLALALQLLLAVQGNPNIPESQKANAVAVANYAIKTATQALAELRNAPVPAANPPAVATSTPPAATSTPIAAATSAPPRITAAADSNYGLFNVSPGSRSQMVGAYVIENPSSEAVNIATTSISLGPAAATTFENVRLLVNRNFWGDAVASATSGRFNFTGGAPFAIPAGGAAKVDVQADVLRAGAGMTSATSLSGCSGAGAISGLPVSCSEVSGQGLTLGTPTVTPYQNQAASSPLSGTIGRANQRIGSYTLTVSLSEPVNINSFTINLAPNAQLANLHISADGGYTQFGQIMNISGTGPYVFQGPAVSIPAGNSTTMIDVYANALLSATYLANATTFAGCGGFGAISGNQIVCGSAVGQDMSFALQ